MRPSRSEKLLDQSLMPVGSPAFVEKHGPFTSPDMLRGVPLIHDDSFSSCSATPNWADWFAAAGVRDADISRGLRFNSADHALDATVEGAGMLLAHDALADADPRTGRLVAPFDLMPEPPPIVKIMLPVSFVGRLFDSDHMRNVSRGSSRRTSAGR